MTKEDGEKDSCCSGVKCGCCVSKCIKAVVLLLLGGVIGYILGGHCAYKKGMCPVSGMSMTAPPNPPSK